MNCWAVMTCPQDASHISTPSGTNSQDRSYTCHTYRCSFARKAWPIQHICWVTRSKAIERNPSSHTKQFQPFLMHSMTLLTRSRKNYRTCELWSTPWASWWPEPKDVGRFGARGRTLFQAIKKKKATTPKEYLWMYSSALDVPKGSNKTLAVPARRSLDMLAAQTIIYIYQQTSCTSAPQACFTSRGPRSAASKAHVTCIYLYIRYITQTVACTGSNIKSSLRIGLPIWRLERSQLLAQWIRTSEIALKTDHSQHV